MDSYIPILVRPQTSAPSFACPGRKLWLSPPPHCAWAPRGGAALPGLPDLPGLPETCRGQVKQSKLAGEAQWWWGGEQRKQRKQREQSARWPTDFIQIRGARIVENVFGSQLFELMRKPHTCASTWQC